MALCRWPSIQNRWQSRAEVPASTVLSDAFSKDLKERGLRFAGSTIIYAYMQAASMVNDHTLDCFRHQELPPLDGDSEVRVLSG